MDGETKKTADKAAAREASQLAEVDKYVEEAGVDKAKADEVRWGFRNCLWFIQL